MADLEKQQNSQYAEHKKIQQIITNATKKPSGTRTRFLAEGQRFHEMLFSDFLLYFLIFSKLNRPSHLVASIEGKTISQKNNSTVFAVQASDAGRTSAVPSHRVAFSIVLTQAILRAILAESSSRARCQKKNN